MNTEIQQSESSIYSHTDYQSYAVDDATIAVRCYGSGPAIIFIHGFPTHGYTWRKLLPELTKTHTCFVIDLPGLGESDWTDSTDFSFTAQARRLAKLIDVLGLSRFDVIAHDTGATIARLLVLQCPDRVGNLVLINTEIPGHRPPWIRTYQFLAKLPLANPIFRLTMMIRFWQRSSLGFGQFYSDKSMLHNRLNTDPYADSVTSSAKRMDGCLEYLKGIEWPVVDRMAQDHDRITARISLIWGENDRTFPVDLARQMVEQFSPSATFTSLPASLLPHEECPDQVLDALSDVLRVS